MTRLYLGVAIKGQEIGVHSNDEFIHLLFVHVVKRLGPDILYVLSHMYLATVPSGNGGACPLMLVKAFGTDGGSERHWPDVLGHTETKKTHKLHVTCLNTTYNAWSIISSSHLSLLSYNCTI